MPNDLLLKELEELKQKYKEVEGARLIACVPAQVRVEIVKTEHRQVTVCLQFLDDYPKSSVLFELKSKVLSDKLLDGLANICEQEAKKLSGQKQILPLLHFVKKFIDDHPLCVCSDEISYIKRQLLTERDELKLKQKASQVTVKLKEGAYYFKVTCTLPENYPLSQMQVQVTDQNFPDILKKNFTMQAVEITRRCVQPPLRRRPKDPPFVAKPSLKPVMEYLVDIIRRFPREVCPICHLQSLPENPENIVEDPSHEKFVERVYCGHLFHHGCLDQYMKIPPFTGGKKCPTCGNRIYHEKWKATPELAEARWAHQEAKHRELAEVVDFLD